MQLGKRGKLISLVGLIFIILMLFGRWWFSSSDIETILSVDEARNGWSLSPGADKIIFRSNEDYILMFLGTKQRHTFEGNKCAESIWLDNKTLLCRNLIIDTDDLSETSYRILDVSEVNIESLLENAGTIYVYKDEPDFIFVLAPDYKRNTTQNYWINGINNLDEVLQGHIYTTIPYPNYNPQPNEKIYSPNRAYYYLFEGGMINIYDTKTGKKLSQTSSSDVRQYRIGGWAADSSGVYFELFSIGISGVQYPLQKLKVPQ